MRNRPVIFLSIAVIIQLVLIGVLLGKQVFTVQTGNTVRIEVEPVDPRSPLRGDYMNLRYSISRIDTDLLSSPGELEGGDTVYVHLEQKPSDKTWKAVSVTKERPANEVSMRGKVTAVGSGMIGVKYGIEQYFIPEGSGRNVNLRNAEVEVKVDRFGNSVLQQLYVNDEPWP